MLFIHPAEKNAIVDRSNSAALKHLIVIEREREKERGNRRKSRANVKFLCHTCTLPVLFNLLLILVAEIFE